MTLPPRVDHRLARRAAETLDNIRNDRTRQVSDQIITRLKGLPALLRTSGPLPVLAFFASKSGTVKPLEKAYALVGRELQLIVAEELGDTRHADAAFGEFVLAMTREDIPADGLARASARLEEFALWLRRLAEATEKEQERNKARPAGGAAGA